MTTHIDVSAIRAVHAAAARVAANAAALEAKVVAATLEELNAEVAAPMATLDARIAALDARAQITLAGAHTANNADSARISAPSPPAAPAAPRRVVAAAAAQENPIVQAARAELAELEARRARGGVSRQAFIIALSNIAQRFIERTALAAAAAAAGAAVPPVPLAPPAVPVPPALPAAPPPLVVPVPAPVVPAPAPLAPPAALPLAAPAPPVRTQGDHRVVHVLDRALYLGWSWDDNMIYLFPDRWSWGLLCPWAVIALFAAVVVITILVDAVKLATWLIDYLIPGTFGAVRSFLLATGLRGVLMGLLSLCFVYAVYGVVSWGVAKTCLVVAGYFIPRDSAVVYKELAYQICRLTGILCGLAVVAAAAAALAAPFPLIVLVFVAIETLGRVIWDVYDLLYRNEPATQEQLQEIGVAEVDLAQEQARRERERIEQEDLQAQEEARRKGDDLEEQQKTAVLFSSSLGCYMRWDPTLKRYVPYREVGLTPHIVP